MFAELEECDKVSGGHSASEGSLPPTYYQSRQSLADELPTSEYMHTRRPLPKRRCARARGAQICAAAVYPAFDCEVRAEISGPGSSHAAEEEEEEEGKTDMKGR